MERMSKPKFIKEIEKFEGKERAECGRWYIRVYGELDHKPMVELESLEIVVKELHKVEEENKKLKSDLSECECSMHFENDEVGYRKRECKNLKEEVRFLEECLDRKEKLNEKYRKEIEELKSTYVYDAKQVRDIC